MTGQAHPWEPRAQLHRAAQAAGFKLSDPQLGRLHRAGLIPSPRIRRLGRGKGTVSEFPPGSTPRLLRVLELQKREDAQKFSTIAWCLWWEDGGPLPGPARELLAGTAMRWDRERDEMFDLLAREDAGDPDAVRQMIRSTRPSKMTLSKGRLESSAAMLGARVSQAWRESLPRLRQADSSPTKTGTSQGRTELLNRARRGRLWSAHWDWITHGPTG